MATAGKTPLRGRPYVALHTRMLNDTDLLVLTVPARCLWPLLLLHTAEQGLDGLIPRDPRRVELVARLGSVADTETAMAELVAAGFLIVEDREWLRIRTWHENQPDVAGEGASSSARRAGQLRRAHNEGRHAEPKDGCDLCATGQEDSADSAPDDGALLPLPKTKSAPKPGSISEVVQDIRDTLDQAVPAAETPVAAYREALATVEAIAENPDVAGRSKDARGTLLNAVLAHALVTYLGDAATSQVINAANRGAKALGSDGHLWYVYAAAKAAGRDFETARKLTGWLATVAANLRAEGRAA